MLRLLTILVINTSLCTYAFGQKRYYQLPPGVDSDDFLQQTIIVKLKDHPGQTSVNSRTGLFVSIQAQKIEPMFPGHQNVAGNRTGKDSRLGNIYKIRIPDHVDLVAAINSLLQDNNVLYAEPYYKIAPLVVPNDPEADSLVGSQDYLSVIHAYQAWEKSQGDTNITIAILDTGVKLDHEDLEENIQYNLNDTINGIDDDGDGLVDNFSGWDIADEDNDPTADSDGHGSEVSGQSSAVTNNGVGIAGMGFDSRFLPIKIFRSDNNEFQNGYEAIVLAAELGAQVINLSWGEPGIYQQLAQDIIDFAVIDSDAVVVAAAGNTNAELDFYPASYQNVLSVGATDNLDNKAGFATYSRFIDLMAPGASNFSTKNDGTYGNTSGSSLSAPLVAGAASLVRSTFPHLNARQVMEQLRLGSDDIYTTGSNEIYTERLGRGRLNVYRALSDTTSPALRMTKVSYSDRFGQFLFHDDSVTIEMDLINLLSPTENAQVDLSTTSSNVSLIQSSWQAGSLPTLTESNNSNAPFTLYLGPNQPASDTISFRLAFTSVDYEDYQYFDLLTSPDFLEVDNDILELTIGGNGNLGYNLDGLQQGFGLLYNQQKVLDQIGLILTTDSNHVSNNVVTDLEENKRDASFATQIPIKYYNNSEASVDARSSFDDSSEGALQLDLRIEQKLLAYPDENFLILDYRLINLSGDTLFDLHTGLYADWNLGDGLSNRADWVDSVKLGFVSDSENNNLVAGISLLSDLDPDYYALENNSLNGNVADLSGTFSKQQKFGFLSGGVGQTTSGEFGPGNDVAHLIGGHVDTILNNGVLRVTFAISMDQARVRVYVFSYFLVSRTTAKTL